MKTSSHRVFPAAPAARRKASAFAPHGACGALRNVLAVIWHRHAVLGLMEFELDLPDGEGPGCATSSSPSSSASHFLDLRMRRHDTSRFNQAVEVSVVPLPFCNRFGTRRRSYVTTFNFAPVFSCLIDCKTPRLGIAQRTFDRKLSPIFIDEDQKMPKPLTAPVLFGLPFHGRRLIYLASRNSARSNCSVAASISPFCSAACINSSVARFQELRPW